MDQNLPNSHDSIMWTDEFIGRTDENGTVISGPGAYWVTLNVSTYFYHIKIQFLNILGPFIK